MTRSSLCSLLTVLLNLLVACSAPPQEINQTSDGLAIHGYDPVAYFLDAGPREGRPEIELRWQGARWRFATREHRQLFQDAPKRYAPQYGGYCAYAVAMGRTADIDPRAWKIAGGRLFLNYDLEVQKTWEAEQARFIAQADRNWPSVLRAGP
ncbi:MAG: YHS domain-containing (seleno)protein [Thermodesulfobacteriota bacterium]